MNSTTKWKFLYWSPMCIGFVLPFIFYSFGDTSYMVDFFKDPDEILPTMAGVIICNIPFIIVSLMSKRDRIHGVKIKQAFILLLVRFIPSFSLYIFLLFDVTRSYIKNLPGASTASLVLLLVPFLGVPAVFLGNYIVRHLQDETHENAK